MATPVGNLDDETRPKQSKKPSNSKFKQQKLPAWQPILTAGSVMPTFFVIAVIFIPVGIGLLVTSDKVQEKKVEYTNCANKDKQSCAEFLAKTTNRGKTCLCEVPLELDQNFETDVYFYYQLSNFYQNHRRYVKSRDDNQLLGKDVTKLNDDCEPYSTINDTQIAPCGAIANSLFNDTLELFLKSENDKEKLDPVPALRTGIAWKTDKEVKFQNPSDPKSYFGDKMKPPYWQKSAWELDPNNTGNNGFVNEDLIVWMRTAALPTFRKLYRRVDHSKDKFKDGLPKGNYLLKVKYAYPVSMFDGTKTFVISNTSWLGGKNPFLGIAYITVGCICFVLGIVFLIIHIKWGKSSPDLNQSTSRTPF